VLQRHGVHHVVPRGGGAPPAVCGVHRVRAEAAGNLNLWPAVSLINVALLHLCDVLHTCVGVEVEFE